MSFAAAFRIAIPLLSSRSNHEDMRWCWGILVRYLTVRRVTYNHGELFVLSSRIVTIALPLMAKRIFLHFPYQIYERTVGFGMLTFGSWQRCIGNGCIPTTVSQHSL